MSDTQWLWQQLYLACLALLCHTLLLAALQDSDVAPMEDDSAPADAAAATQPPASSSLPEVELYIHLLVLMYLLDRKQYKQVLPAHPALSAAYRQPAT